ncbi:MAG: hypothetical protein ACRC2V_10460, partial [Xenococcaceae cyanobacterium]
HFDLLGFCTTPEISPPVGLEVDRDSETLGVTTHEYHPKCETAKQVGWPVQWRLLNAWQELMDSTGLAHTISANIWSSQLIDENWISKDFLSSKIQTTYYRTIIDTEALDKSEVLTPNSSPEKLESLYKEFPACAADDPQYCESCGS